MLALMGAPSESGTIPGQQRTTPCCAAPGMTTTFCEEDSWSSSLLFLLVHRQHSLSDQKAAENVDRGEYQRDEAEDARPQRAVGVDGERHADREQRADYDHR